MVPVSTTIPAETLWLVISVVAVATYGLRLSFLLLFGRIDEVPDVVDAPLRYVAPAVLAALVLPELLVVDGSIAVANPRLVAGLVAGVVAWRTENIAATVGVGMIVLWAVRWLL